MDMAAYLFSYHYSYYIVVSKKFQNNFVDYHNIAQAFGLDLPHFGILLNHKKRVASSRDLDLWYSASSAKR